MKDKAENRKNDFLDDPDTDFDLYCQKVEEFKQTNGRDPTLQETHEIRMKCQKDWE